MEMVHTIKDTTKDYLDKASGNIRSPFKEFKQNYSRKNKRKKSVPRKGPEIKVLKIKFTDGSFQVIRNVLEFSEGYKFFFIAYIKENMVTARVYKRETIEVVSRRESDGNYKNVRLKRNRKFGE
jgi:hypothetical protein